MLDNFSSDDYIEPFFGIERLNVTLDHIVTQLSHPLREFRYQLDADDFLCDPAKKAMEPCFTLNILSSMVA
jgi:hypothetical protein